MRSAAGQAGQLDYRLTSRPYTGAEGYLQFQRLADQEGSHGPDEKRRLAHDDEAAADRLPGERRPIDIDPAWQQGSGGVATVP